MHAENGTATHHHTCPLCEANCNLSISTRGREVVSVRGDDADPFSNGFICPKGPALAQLDADPDRLRTPMIRRGSEWREATWDEAFARGQAAFVYKGAMVDAPHINRARKIVARAAAGRAAS
jgi:anaerobic selenocysteine-containing dehydrogenase